MSHNQFRGTGVALVTPFKGGQIDFPAFGKIIKHCINGGLEYLVALGTTGEVPTLNKEEKFQILDFTVKTVAGRVPVVAGFGGNDTQAIINLMEAYHFRGIDAVLSSSPAYNKPSQEGIYQHYMALEKKCPVPIIIYNVPGRTSSNLTAETTLRLAHASKKFIAIKEAAYDLDQVSKVIKHRPNGFLVLSGNDTIALPLLSLGGDGVISVIANALPKQCSDMIRYGLNNNFKKASEIHLSLFDIHHWLYKDGNPSGIKAAMQMLGICSDETRLPIVPVSDEVRDKLRSELEKANILIPRDAIA